MKPPLAILEEAVQTYKPHKVFALFSGGHDSLLSTYFAMRFGIADAVVHINTGIGIKQTRQYVRETCTYFGWNLLEYRAVDCGQVYADIVCQYGFPGPAQHQRMYIRLKERPLEALKRDHAPRLPMLLIAGIRKAESVKRMGYAKEVNVQGQWIWVAPIVDWSDTDCEGYMQSHSLPRNPVKDAFCMSGECLCGSNARPEERAEIKVLFPDEHAEISELEAKAQACGVWAHWGMGGPSKAFQAEQQGQLFMPLCSSCQFAQEAKTP